MCQYFQKHPVFGPTERVGANEKVTKSEIDLFDMICYLDLSET